MQNVWSLLIYRHKLTTILWCHFAKLMKMKQCSHIQVHRSFVFFAAHQCGLSEDGKNKKYVKVVKNYFFTINLEKWHQQFFVVFSTNFKPEINE